MFSLSLAVVKCPPLPSNGLFTLATVSRHRSTNLKNGVGSSRFPFQMTRKIIRSGRARACVGHRGSQPEVSFVLARSSLN